MTDILPKVNFVNAMFHTLFIADMHLVLVWGVNACESTWLTFPLWRVKCFGMRIAKCMNNMKLQFDLIAHFESIHKTSADAGRMYL